MRISVLSSDVSNTADTSEPSSGQETTEPGRRRRGVTAMEYLVMISFILVVVIVSVQYVGSAAKGLFQSSASATEKTNEPESDSP